MASFLLFMITGASGFYHPHEVLAGWIIKYECADVSCEDDCLIVSREAVHFGICIHNKIHHCHPQRDHFVSFEYTNNYCHGEPRMHLTSDICYREQSDGCCGLWPGQ